jgi:TPR repeat protein
LAKYNNVDAIYGDGIAYETGRGVVENKTTAFEWFMIEGNLGHPEARALCGKILYYGEGSIQDASAKSVNTASH